MDEKIIEERIKKNRNLYSKSELKFIKENDKLIKKTYLLGLIDGAKIFYTK